MCERSKFLSWILLGFNVQSLIGATILQLTTECQALCLCQLLQNVQRVIEEIYR